MKKLLLCAGPRSAPYGQSDWFRVDSDPRVEPDLICSVPPMPVKVRAMAPFDRIALIHGIEHFYPWDAFQLLVECRDMLAKDGILILEQPDLSKCNSKAEWIFGDPDHCNPDMLHKWGYIPATLSEMLMGAGFKRTLVKPALFHDPARDFRIEGYVTI